MQWDGNWVCHVRYTAIILERIIQQEQLVSLVHAGHRSQRAVVHSIPETSCLAWGQLFTDTRSTPFNREQLSDTTRNTPFNRSRPPVQASSPSSNRGQNPTQQSAPFSGEEPLLLCKGNTFRIRGGRGSPRHAVHRATARSGSTPTKMPHPPGSTGWFTTDTPRGTETTTQRDAATIMIRGSRATGVVERERLSRHAT